MMPQRKSAGTLAIELAISVSVFGLLAFFFAMSCVVANAARVNDTVCRDAARAAAQESNKQDARSAARSVVQTYDGVHLVAIAYENKGNDPSAAPYVQVTTSTDVKSPFALWMHTGMQGNRITFTQTYAFPIVNLARVDRADQPDPEDY